MQVKIFNLSAVLHFVSRQASLVSQQNEARTLSLVMNGSTTLITCESIKNRLK